jgi:F-type H+-transporting ATPase subunit b
MRIMAITSGMIACGFSSAMAAESGLPQLDPSSFSSQLFWLAITFIALYLFMARGIIPKIHDVLDYRQHKLSHDLDRAEQLKQEAEDAKTSYETALKEAKANAQLVMSETLAAIDKNMHKQQDELDASLAKKMAEAQADIAKASAKAHEELQPTAEEITVSIIEKLVNIKVDIKAVSKAVTEHTKA